MIVYIAEKPDIATAMAAYLWSDYSSYKHKHCYQKGDVIVTWAYGHIMMTAMPEAYGKEYADFSTYPVIPSTWKKRPSPSTKEQFEYIRSVLGKADVVVNGGDPDREGQLLIDEILEYVRYKGEVRRILINAKDTLISKDMNEKEFVDETIAQWEIDYPIKKVLKLKKCTIDWDAVFGNDEE